MLESTCLSMTITRLHDKTYSTIKLCKSSLELNEVNRFLLKIPLVKSFLFEQIYQIFFSRMDSYLPVGSICEARSVTILRSASIDPSVKARDWNITPRRIQKFNLLYKYRTKLYLCFEYLWMQWECFRQHAVFL